MTEFNNTKYNELNGNPKEQRNYLQKTFPIGSMVAIKESEKDFIYYDENPFTIINHEYRKELDRWVVILDRDLVKDGNHRRSIHPNNIKMGVKEKRNQVLLELLK